MNTAEPPEHAARDYARATPSTRLESRILVLAPTGSDSRHTAEFLIRAQMTPAVCRSAEELAKEVQQGCAAILVAEEAINASGASPLAEVLSAQPAWSDVPVVLVTSGGESVHVRARRLNVFGATGNVMVLERPFRSDTLVSLLEVALRARRRQYEVRDLLRERAEAAANLERVVAERTAKLRDLVEQLEAFSYSITHDMRGPLRAIHSYARLLEMKSFEGPDDERMFLARIRDAAKRLDRLIQDVLQFSRVSRGEMPIEPVDTEQLLRAILDEYPNLQEHRDCISVESPLPRVRANAAALTQCLSNLLGNAVKFVPAGRKPSVRVFGTSRDGRTRITVQDNGIGIAGHYHERIFQAFERLHDNSRYEGTGIGLAIVKRAVERMNGTLGVESVVGQGSRFWIELPAA